MLSVFFLRWARTVVLPLLTQLNTSAMAQHLTECEHPQFLANLQGQYNRLNNLPSFLNSSIKNLIFNHYKILYLSKSTHTNKLLLI